MEPEGPVRGYVVAQVVEALRHKPEGRVFDSRFGSLGFFIGVDPACNRNEYKKYLVGGKGG
jgi:hypothetical protein